jgi:hypothetical protein
MLKFTIVPTSEQFAVEIVLLLLLRAKSAVVQSLLLSCA